MKLLCCRRELIVLQGSLHLIAFRLSDQKKGLKSLAINVSKACFGFISSFGSFSGPHEHTGNGEHGGNGHDLV